MLNPAAFSFLPYISGHAAQRGAMCEVRCLDSMAMVWEKIKTMFCSIAIECSQFWHNTLSTPRNTVVQIQSAVTANF